MTSLARQLQQLAVPHTKVVYGQDKRKKSLLFDPKEAATLDRETFHSIGINGLEELQNIDPVFGTFSSSLFSEASVTFERSIVTAEVNEELDQVISQFLINLSPYCLLRPAHKALEWLIYRYHIHLYNIDDLVMCFLPFHESKIFVRVIQLLDLGSKTATKWDWLLCLQKSGVHLPRSTLVNHCRTFVSFLSFVCANVQKAIKLHKGDNKSVPQLKVLFSFYTTTVIGVLESDTVTERVLSTVIPPLTKGLKSKMTEYKAASFMILAQLLHKAKLKPSLLKTLMNAMTKHMTADILKDAMMCLILVFQTQANVELARKTFRMMCHCVGATDILIQLSVMYQAESLISAFLLRLVPVAFRQETNSSDSESEGIIPDYISILHKLMHNLRLEKTLAENIARQVLESYVQLAVNSDENIDNFNENCMSIVRLLEGRYSEAMDKALKSIMSNMKTDEEKDLITSFLNLSVVSVQHHLVTDSMSNLVLSLNHRLPSIREQSVRYLLQNIEEVTDSSFVQEAILSRLQDESNLVVMSVLHAGKNLWKYVDAPDELSSKLVDIIKKSENRKQWHKTALLAVEILCGYKSREKEEFEGILPYLFCRNSGFDCELRKLIINSDLVQNNILFKSIIKKWPIIMEKQCSTSNIDVAELLAEGIIKSETDYIPLLQKWYESCWSCPRQQCLLLLIFDAMLPLVIDKENKLLICLLQTNLLSVVLETKDIIKDQTTNLHSWVKSVKAACTNLNKRTPIPMVLSVAAVHRIINQLQLPSTLLTGSEFWQLNGINNSYDTCLKVMVKLFDLILEQTDQKVFRQLVMEFTKTLLTDTRIMMRFFCMLWSSHRNPEKYPLAITSVLQAKAVKLGRVHLTALTAEKNSLGYILHQPDPVITSLLMLLTSPHQSLRQEAVDCLHFLYKSSSAVDSPFRVMLRKLSRCREELVADSTYLPQVLAKCFRSASTASDNETDCQTSPRKRMSHQEARAKSLHKVLDLLVDDQTPLFIQKSLLELLCLLNNPDVFCCLLPLMRHMMATINVSPTNKLAGDCLKLLIQRYTPETASLLTNKSTALNFFLTMLRTETLIGTDTVTVQQAVLEQIDEDLFSLLHKDVQFQVFTTLIGIWAQAKTPEVPNIVRKIIKHLSLDADLVVMEIEFCLKSPSALTLKQAKRRKKEVVETVGEEETTEFDTLPWLRCAVALEAIQNKKKLCNASVLLPVCFTAISRVLDSEHHTSAENLKYLLLSVIHKIFIKLLANKDTADTVPEEVFNIELIVQCVRTSENPQTQHQSLLVLTEAAKIYPEKILHNMMSVFTFMGSSILRQDDAYSFHIISRLLVTVIPALIQACKERKNVPKGVTSEVEDVIIMVIHVFVDAYPHIPEHRQLMLFYRLMEILDNGRYLWMVLLLLTEVMVTKEMFKADLTTSKQGVVDLFPNLHFCLTLCVHFDPSVVFDSARKAVQYVADLPDVKGKDVIKKRRLPQSFGKLQKEDTTIFNVDYHTDKQLRYFKYSAIHLLVSVFTYKDFIAKLMEVGDDSLMEKFRDLIETLLTFISHLTKTSERLQATPMAKYWKGFLHKVCELLDRVISLLPDHIFLEVISGLMNHQLPNIQRKSMELLNTKLLERKSFQESEEHLLVPVVNLLCEIVKKSSLSSKRSNDGPVNSQTALYSLKLLCRVLGNKHPQLFIEVLKMSTNIFISRKDVPQLAACACLCIAEVCNTLKVHVIQHLSLFMPHVIKAMDNKEYLLSNELFLLSTVATIHKVSENLAPFLSPYLLDIMRHVCSLSVPDEKVEILQKSQFQLKLKSIRHILATVLPPRVIIPVITECYGTIVQTEVKCVGPLMSVLSEHVTNMKKEDLTDHLQQLQNFFMEALDFRAKFAKLPEVLISSIESSVIDTIITLVMKLSEATFKPLLLRLYEWATRSKENLERVLVFYRLCDCLAGKLRSLFTLFAGHIISHAVSVLKECNCAEGVKSYFGSSNAGKQKTCCLLNYILDCLYKCFLHDTERFVGKERFDSLMQPLVDQLENMQGGDAAYKSRVSDHLIPCIVEFAVDAQESSSWQALNYQVLLKTRHSTPEVRYAALEMIDELHRKLGEDYMFLLPETIPFLAELMEDESEEVEAKCQSVVSEMEKTLGEPLQKYF
ncbi:hypothetical protein ScPMuIL_005584 [Solemya velum]